MKRWRSTGESSGLSSTVFVPNAYITVDIFRSESPRLVTLDPSDNGSVVDSGPDVVNELPDGWLRLALVNGVDRWLDAPGFPGLLADWNEGLILADLASAHSRVGNDDLAQHFWDGAKTALEDFIELVLTQTNAARVGHPALVTELARVYADAPYFDANTASAIQNVLGPPPTWHPELDLRVRELVTVRHKGASASVAAYADPRLVPARVLADKPTATLTDDTIQVTVPAFAGLDAATPAAERLLMRLIAKDDLSVISLGLLELGANSMFSGTLPANGNTPGGLVVEVFDGDAVGGPYVDDDARRTKVERLQKAFTFERLAASARSLGISEQANVLADWAQKAAPDGTDLSGVAPEGAGNGPLRPLLVELANGFSTALE